VTARQQNSPIFTLRDFVSPAFSIEFSNDVTFPSFVFGNIIWAMIQRAHTVRFQPTKEP